MNQGDQGAKGRNEVTGQAETFSSGALSSCGLSVLCGAKRHKVDPTLSSP